MTKRLDSLKGRGAKILACGLVIGDPHLDATLELMFALARGGADVIELLVPFTDPMFHGKVVQRATDRAIREDVNWEDVVTLLEHFRREDDETVVVATVYGSILHRRGFEAAAEHLRAAGFDAISVPDFPWDESGELIAAFRAEGLEVISMIATTTSEERRDAIANDAGGFILWSAHAGGDFTAGEGALASSLDALCAIAPVPVLAAMQISTPEEAKEAASHCDGIIVGSSLVWQIEGRGADIEERIEGFVRDLRQAIDSIGPTA